MGTHSEWYLLNNVGYSLVGACRAEQRHIQNKNIIPSYVLTTFKIIVKWNNTGIDINATGT